MIAVKATLRGNSSYQDHTKIFSAVINAGGLQNGYDHNFIRRNYVYRLRIYFDGESFDNIPVTPDPGPGPDPEPEVDTNLNIAVQVVDAYRIDSHLTSGERRSGKTSGYIHQINTCGYTGQKDRVGDAIHILIAKIRIS